MFGIDSSELAIVALVALLVIGPKDLPRVMRMVGAWVAKGRAMTRHVRVGFDTMMREAELEEMQKAWAAQNDAIMKATALPDFGMSEPAALLGQEEWTPPTPPIAPDIPAETPPEIAAKPSPKPRRSRAKPKPEPAPASAPHEP